MDLVWYASYGSNMSQHRFSCYLRGGCPPGATRTYPGARDPSPPRRAEPVTLRGSVYFVWDSPTWGGGIAFYDPRGNGESVGRAYLLTTGQFSDVATQEMHRAPGGDLDLVDVLADGSAVLGPGRYEALHVVGEIADIAVVTFTASWDVAELELNPPAAAYLETMATGLREAHGWSTTEIVDYLLRRPGVSVGWGRAGLTRLVDG